MMACIIRRQTMDGKMETWDRVQKDFFPEPLTERHIKARCEYKNHAGANLAGRRLMRQGVIDLGVNAKYVEWGHLHVPTK